MLCEPLSGRLDTILDGDPGRAGHNVLPGPPNLIVEHQSQKSYSEKKLDAPTSSNVRLGIENVAA